MAIIDNDLKHVKCILKPKAVSEASSRVHAYRHVHRESFCTPITNPLNSTLNA